MEGQAITASSSKRCSLGFTQQCMVLSASSIRFSLLQSVLDTQQLIVREVM